MSNLRTKTGQKPDLASKSRRRKRDLAQTMKAVLDHQETAVILTSPDMSVLYMNSAAESLVGTSLHFAEETRVDQLVCDPTLSIDAWRQVLEDEAPVTKRGARLILKDGSHLMADYRVTPLAHENAILLELNAINRLVRIGRDDQSVNALETSRQLARGLAHEVKNPLGGIRGAAQLLQRKLEKLELATEMPSHTDYTQVIIQEADRLTHLVDNMLGPTRAPSLAPTNIHGVIARVVQLIELEAEDDPDGIPLTVWRDFDPSLPELAADEEQLVQAILNIARNALQALGNTPDPTLTFRTRIVRQFTIGSTLHRLVLRLDVQDNGPGVPPELLDRIFYPMISGRPDGSGLGLAITQSIVGQHEGLLELESRPGHTCFSLFLPFRELATDDE